MAARRALTSPGPGSAGHSLATSRSAIGPAGATPGFGCPAGPAGGRLSVMPGDQRAASGDDRRRVEVQPERVGRREGGHDHLEPLERQRSGGQRGLCCAARRDSRVGSLPGAVRVSLIRVRLARIAESARPQQAGDLLEVALAG